MGHCNHSCENIQQEVGHQFHRRWAFFQRIKKDPLIPASQQLPAKYVNIHKFLLQLIVFAEKGWSWKAKNGLEERIPAKNGLHRFLLPQLFTLPKAWMKRYLFTTSENQLIQKCLLKMDFSSCPIYPRWPRQQARRFYLILLRWKWVNISLPQTISLKYFQKASSTSNFHFNQERPFISSIPAFSSKDSILIYIGSSLLRFPEKGWKGNYLKGTSSNSQLIKNT